MKKIIASLYEAGEFSGVEEMPTTGPDFNRIANALERIAFALEKLSGDTVITPVPINQNLETKVIHLENKVAPAAQSVKPTNSTSPKKD